MASPFCSLTVVASQANAVIVRTSPGAKPFGLQSVDGRTLSASQAKQLLELGPKAAANLHRILGLEPFRVGQKCVIEFEDLETHEIDEVIAPCTEANFLANLEAAGDDSKTIAQEQLDKVGEEGNRDDHEANEDENDDDSDENDTMTEMRAKYMREKKTHMAFAQAFLGVLAIGQELGFSEADLDELYVRAGGAVVNASDDETNRPTQQGQQCQQQ